MLPKKRIIVLDPSAPFADRSAVVTEALEGLGGQVRVERLAFSAPQLRNNLGEADLFIFLAADGASQQRSSQLSKRSPRPHLFAAGSIEALLAAYPPEVVLFAVTEGPQAVPAGMFYFDAATLRSKIVEVLDLSPNSTRTI